MKRGMKFTSEAQNLGPEFYSLMDHLFKKKLFGCKLTNLI